MKTQIWHRIIDGLNKAELDYVLVGASALVVHGLPRSTLDIDIYVRAKEDTLNKIFQIAEGVGLSSEQKAILKIRHLPELFVNQWICFSYEGQDVLDVFLAEEKEFDRLYKNSEQKKDKGFSVRVASLQDIKAMKKASGRAIDMADVKLIEELRDRKDES